MQEENIYNLIKRLCPNGVKYVKLCEVAEVYTGQQLNKNDMLKEGFPVLNGGINYSGYTNQYNENENTITVSQGGASAGYVNWINEKFWAGAHCFVVKLKNNSQLNNRFLYFVLKHLEYKITNLKHGAGIPGLQKQKLQSIEIPLPPMEIQERIVEILDKFSALTEALTEEVRLRKLEYEYYRDKLLSADNLRNGGGYQVVTLGEIGKFYNGVSGKSKKDFINGNAKLVTYMNVYKNSALDLNITDTLKINAGEKQNKVMYGDMLFTTSSETPDECAMSSEVRQEPKEDLYLNSFCFGFRLNDVKMFHRGFLQYYFRCGTMRKQIRKTANGVTRFNVSKSKFEKLKISLPSLEKQKEIVEKLDKFEKLVNDINEGLPKEIELRKKMYEYYREKLLSFDKRE